MENGQAGETIATSNPITYNVEAIAKLEHEALLERSRGERISDRITRLIGNIWFVAFHLLFFLLWIVVNLGLVRGVPVFDPYPFGLLSLIVCAEGVFLAVFILVSQSRMSRQADRRAHLSLQVSMLAEQEMTMLLRMQQEVARHLGIDVETVKEHSEDLMEQTDVKRLVDHLEEKLPRN